MVLRDAQTGFAGESGHIWTIEKNGTWRHQTFLNAIVRDADRSGKLSVEKLGQLVGQIEKAKLTDLPNQLGKNPGVNPHKISIRYGDKTIVLTLQGGKNLPGNPMEIDDLNLQKFAQVASLVKKLTSSKR